MRVLELKPFPYSVRLVVGKDEWLEFCESNPTQEDRTWFGSSTMGDVHQSGSISLVRLSEECTDEFFVHEAVHVVQQMCEYIGESSPSDEFQAYMTQHVFAWLQEQHSAATTEVGEDENKDEAKSDQPVVNAEAGQEPG